MGVRESLNEKKTLGLGVAAAVGLLAVVIIGAQVVGGGSGVSEPETAFYTDDDGKTFFKDDIYKVVPFDHNGKQAYRADVFKGPDGKQFVGLMYRHNALGKKAMQEHIAKGKDDPRGTFLGGLEIQGMEVKRPGAPDNTWRMNDTSLQSSIKSPSGGPAELVEP
jgi:hypothetical protein